LTAHVNRERLFARLPSPRVGRYGIAEQDIARVQVVPQAVDELIDCLKSDDETDVIFGLYFAECLRPRADFSTVARLSLPKIASLIRASLGHSSPRVRADAVRAFAAFRESYGDYAIITRDFLHSPDSGVRRNALGSAPSFLSSTELGILLAFRNDPEFGETGGMGGPLRYDLRDFALEIAEHIAGQRFDTGDCVECRDGRQISWRSWSAFTQWLENRKKRSFFGI